MSDLDNEFEGECLEAVCPIDLECECDPDRALFEILEILKGRVDVGEAGGGRDCCWIC